MFPHGSCFARRVAARGASDAGGTAEIAWTRVHAITDQSTCVNRSRKWRDQRTYLSPRGRAESVRSSSRWTAGDGLTSRSWSDGYSEVWFFSLIAGIWSVGFQSDGVGDAWKNTTIAVRSNRNRGAIEPQSWILPHGIYPTIIERQFRGIWSTIDARSWSIMVDRAKIVAYFEALFEAKFKPIQPGVEATMLLSANRSHDALIPLPRPPLLA